MGRKPEIVIAIMGPLIPVWGNCRPLEGRSFLDLLYKSKRYLFCGGKIHLSWRRFDVDLDSRASLIITDLHTKNFIQEDGIRADVALAYSSDSCDGVTLLAERVGLMRDGNYLYDPMPGLRWAVICGGVDYERAKHVLSDLPEVTLLRAPETEPVGHDRYHYPKPSEAARLAREIEAINFG